MAALPSIRRIVVLLLVSILTTTIIWPSAVRAATIWPDTTVPSVIDAGPDSEVELGVRFRSDSAGQITGLRFYKSVANTGVHVANLWDSAGTLLATATFTNESPSGWQQVSFATPVTIAPSTTYIASYHTNAGHYSIDPAYFSGKGVDNPPLHASADGAGGMNGVFAYGVGSAFPTKSWSSSNYWVDVVFTADGAPASGTTGSSTLFGSTLPGMVDSGPDGAVELGVRFTSDADGAVTGLRFYKAAANSGPHVANLWGADGTLLATAPFINETPSGWQQADFSSPVAIFANRVYVASYHAGAGHYSIDTGFFAGKGVDAPPLHLLADGVSGSNGVYAYGTPSRFPDRSWNSANYWVEPLYSQTSGGTTGKTATGPGPEPADWVAGDMHVHRSCGGPPEAVESIAAGMIPRNLAVVSLLADMGNGEVREASTDLPLVNGQDSPVSTLGQLVHWDAEWHWDPIYFQFPHQALGGHVVALGVNESHQVGEEYTFPIFDWAHRQGGIAGFAHMQYLDDAIPQNLTCCTPLEFPVEVALGTVDFISEDVADVNYSGPTMYPENAILAYYRLLNCGFRPGLAAGTDYPCNNGASLGSLLTYVQVPGGEMTYRNWTQGIAKGRTVVSRNGHDEFLNLQVNGTATPGDEVQLAGPGTVPVTVQWTATQPLFGTMELVHNGIVVASQDASVAPGGTATLTASVDFGKSGWLAARRMGSSGHMVHTAAVFVTVGNAPVRASAADAEYFVQWIDNLLEKTSPGGAWNRYFVKDLAVAQERYRAARGVFQQIALEAAAPAPVTFTIWPDTITPALVDAGPDSMVEVGVKFRADASGYVTGIRFYKADSNTGPHVGNLWGGDGTLLATATFSNETASGWQQVTFSKPVPVTVNSMYVASYHTSVGHYSDDQYFFADAGPSVTLPGGGISLFNGVYAYGSTSSFPAEGWHNSNYWVDLLFVPVAPSPTLVTTTGTDGTSGASGGGVPTATTLPAGT